MKTLPTRKTDSTYPILTIETIENRIERSPSQPVIPSDVYRHAAVAMSLCDLPGEGLHLLFIRRAEHPGDPWSGQIAFPGGHIDPEDPTPQDAAIRETEEELGVVIDRQWYIGLLDDVCPSQTRPYNVIVMPHLFFLPEPPQLTPNYEVAEAFWISLASLSNPANVRPFSIPGDPRHRTFPSFSYGGRAIWGLTYRMIADLMNRLEVSLPTEQDYLI